MKAFDGNFFLSWLSLPKTSANILKSTFLKNTPIFLPSSIRDILVNMIMTDESWYVVRNTPGVTGFVGMGNTPTPLRTEEVSQIIKRMEADAPRIKVTFKSGERVRIVDGPFNDFRGTVSEIDMERAKVRVMVNFFGRETPVELDFLQVEKT
jgi:transcriptional antiterminator NusG